MSAERKEQIKEFLVEYDEAEEKRRAAKDQTAPFKGGHAALMRHIGQHPAREVKGVLTREGDLEKDGSQFILISVALLEAWGCPEGARDFVYIMEGLANGNHTDLLPFSDEQISTLTGFSTETIRAKRRELMEWERGHNATIIEIKEKAYNPEKGKIERTQYRVAFIKVVSDFIRDARANTYFQRNPVRAIENAETNSLAPMIQEAWNNLSTSPVEKRPPKKEKPPKDDKVELATRYRSSALSALRKWSDCEYELGRDLENLWDELIMEMSTTVSEAKNRWEFKQNKGQFKKHKGAWKGIPKKVGD